MLGTPQHDVFIQACWYKPFRKALSLQPPRIAQVQQSLSQLGLVLGPDL